MSSNIECQLDEVNSLKSIYNEEEITVTKNEDGLITGQFYASVDLLPEFVVKHKDLQNGQDEIKCLNISYLPPICLYFELPPTYPSESPPKYSISCPWLNFGCMIKLCKKLDSLWELNKGSEILFTWTTFLKLESMDYLKLTEVLYIHLNPMKNRNAKYDSYINKLDLNNENPTAGSSKSTDKAEKGESKSDRIFASTSISNHKLLNSKEESCACDNKTNIKKNNFRFRKSSRNKPYRPTRNKAVEKYRDKIKPKNTNNVLDLIICYNEERCKSEFAKQRFHCGICFEVEIGGKCIQFKPCNHIYCIQCVKSYFEIRLQENTVQTMPCPYDKCSSEASQTQIKEILGAKLYERYDSLLLSATLDGMSDIIYCPRKDCQTPVMIEQPERMAICSNCKLAFCVFCKMTYHGIEPCKINEVEKRDLALEYESSTGERKQWLESRYGKKHLDELLHNVKSDDWLNRNTKTCPKCSTYIEKIQGCNKMVCGKCGIMFCWLCGTKLNPENPYKHFFDINSECHELLFQGLPGLIGEYEEDDDFDFEYGDDVFGGNLDYEELLDMIPECFGEDDLNDDDDDYDDYYNEVDDDPFQFF